jgi:hypothetical protein
MVLPKAVLKKINVICRAFLWKGMADYNGPGQVSWDRLCKSKAAGGLGLRNTIKWNEAALGKYVWAIATKQDNLWGKWVHAVYIKKTNWWDYNSTIEGSWYWRQIVRIKETHKTLPHLQSAVTGKYSIHLVYSHMNDEQEKVKWFREVWNSYNIPKHRIILWLTVQNQD